MSNGVDIRENDILMGGYIDMTIIRRSVIAVNEMTGERKFFESVYACAKYMNVCTQAVQLAQGLGGVCKGWRIYDEPERIRERIEDLKNQLVIVESLLQEGR